MPHMDFATWLDTHMRDRGLTPADLATAAGLAQSVVSRWRTGRVRPSVDNIRAAAHALRVPVVDGLIAAGILSPDDIAPPTAEVTAASLSDEELIEELARRLRERKTPRNVAASL